MEANDEGDGVQMAEVASAAEHVRPPTQTNVRKARIYFLNPCPLNYLVSK